MSDDIFERLEQPEYTGENRCAPCTALNLALAAVLAVLLGRRNRALGILAFLASVGLIYLRGYLVPGTPELTKQYLPEPVLVLFGKSDRPEPMDETLTRHAADRAAGDAESESAADDAGSASTAAAGNGTTAEGDTAGGDPVDEESESEWVSAGDVDDEPADDEPTDDEPADDTEANSGAADTEDSGAADTEDSGAADTEDSTEVPREELDELLSQSMDRILESFAVVEEVDGDLDLVDEFHDGWVEQIDDLAGDPDEQGSALAEVFEEPPSVGEIELRDDDRYYGLLDGTRKHSWITEAAVVTDLAANRVLEAGEDPRWGALEPKERLSILRGFRVFLTTCPECGGPVSASDDVVESCCGEWDVIAVGCDECDARVLELTPPDAKDTKQAGAGAAGKRGITR